LRFARTYHRKSTHRRGFVTIWEATWSQPAGELEANALWDSFCLRFDFRPSMKEPSQPAINEPNPSVVFDLSVVSAGDSLKAVELVLSAFRLTVPVGDELAFLDWQHPTFRFSPHDPRIGSNLPVFPDGDYYIVVASDLSYGTFGHPWQESLCVFGESLIAHLPPELFRLLPVLRQRF
jgi:hypothetical protein